MMDMTGENMPYQWPQAADGSSVGRIWFGGDYNPEQWDEKTWDEDIRLMQRVRINIVSLGIFSWARIQLGPDQWDFEWLDTVIDKLGDAGIWVDLASATASPPPWLTTLHPEILPVDIDGNTVWPGARQAWRPTSPVFKEYALAMCTQMAEHYRDDSRVVSWHIGNEYGCHNRFDYSDDAMQAFQAWCEKRYGTIDAVNEAWGTDFWSQRMTDFSQIIPPRNVGGEGNFVNPTKLLDFKRFSSDALKDFYIAERNTILAVVPGKPVTTNFMVSQGATILDYADWASEVSFVSNDHYFLPGPAHLDELLYSASFIDGLSGKKPWFVMEDSTSAVNWRPVNFRKRPGEMVRDSMANMAMGADALCFFQWRQSQAGAEKFHSAMVPHAGEDSEVFRNVCTLGESLSALADAGIVGSRLAQSPVAIIYDIDSQWAVEHSAMPAQGRLQQTEPLEWFRAFLDMGVTPDMVPTTAHWEKYQAVVFPAVYMMSAETVCRIKKFVRAGGKVFITYSTCVSDMNDHVWLGGYPGPLGEVVGVRIEEFNPLEPSLAPGDRLELTSGAAARYWADVITSTAPTCEVLERYKASEFSGMEGVPAVTINSYGDGQAVYVGTRLSHRDLADILSPVVERFGLLGAGKVDSQLVRVVREKTDVNGVVMRQFIFTFNRGQEAVSCELGQGDVIFSSRAVLAGNSNNFDSSDSSARIEPAGVVIQSKEVVK
jgi:beta-galactosidase